MEALRVEGLSKNFGGLQVLEGISFSVEEGVHLAIIGPNGAGKTTLLNVLTGELLQDAGSIFFLGRNITTLPTHQRVHLGLSRSFQISNLFFNLTVIDNVLVALHGTENSRFQMFRSRTTYSHLLFKAQQLLESMGLWERRDSLTKDLSHGEQRRLEIALSLASEPKLLLLDEPTAGLAIGETSNFINTIQHLARGSTVIFSAHDMDAVFTLADRILVIYFGQVLAIGAPKEIQANSKVKEIYLGIRENIPNAGSN